MIQEHTDDVMPVVFQPNRSKVFLSYPNNTVQVSPEGQKVSQVCRLGPFELGQ